MNDFRKTKLFARYEVTDQYGNRTDCPAILLWAAETTINTVRVRKLPEIVECISDIEETLLYDFNRYADVIVSHFCDRFTQREVYQFSTMRYGETHVLVVWIETYTPDFGYEGEQSLFPPIQR